ncbi:hypothetical protein ADK74_36615, partial [Streptomyces decoyicus]
MTFTVSGPGGGTLTAPLDASGTAFATTSTLAAGSHSVTAVYGGDANFTSSTGTDTQTVNRAATSTTVTSAPDPSVFGQGFTVTARVAAVPPGAGTPTGTVTFTIDGVGPFDVALDASGQAHFTNSTLAAGGHTVTAVYNGDADFSGSTGSHTQSVHQAATTTTVTALPDPSVSGQRFTVTAVVAPLAPGAGVPTGTVTFALSGGGSIEVPLDATGKATVRGSLTAGQYTGTATYNGDVNFTRSSDSTTHTVTPSAFGQAVTVTATVSPVAPGAGTPTGSVAFTIDGGQPIDVPLGGSGQATLVTSALAPGSHDITALYSGDTDFVGSSGSDTQTVHQAATTTMVVSSPDPSAFGQPVTFTASVVPVLPGAGAPTGTVTFTLTGPGGGTLTATVDTGGTAEVTTSALKAGSHTVTATYSGDAAFTGSTGADTH